MHGIPWSQGLKNKRRVEGYITIYGGRRGFPDTNSNGEKYGGNTPEALVSIILSWE
jgi:hypothetical protein